MEKLPDNAISGPSKIPSMGITKDVGTGAWVFKSESAVYDSSSDATLFSCSLPVLPHEKLSINRSVQGHQSVDDAAASLNKLQDVEGDDSLEDVANQAMGVLLPDDEDELLAGVMDGFDLSILPSQLDDLEDGDLFGSLGGMELESDVQESLSLGLSKVNITDGVVGNGIVHYGPPNGVGTVAGEHPYGEHPSRTLFVRNINSNVEDSELKSLFEQYGDIRTLYTACKHRGFVMISYYDIRDARAAMRALQNKPLRRRKLDIHFSIPKDNPSEKDINQGTLVVFNLDPSVSNEDLRQIFGAYGEVKEIRETPHKRHHKFIEFYDVRAAEAALRALNRSDIAGKRIKLEPSRPGGTRRNLMLQLNQELELDESRTFRHHIGSPIANSPPGNWLQYSSPIDHSPLYTLSRSPGFSSMSPTTSNHLPGLASILHSQASNSVKIAPIGKDQGRGSHVDNIFSNVNSEQRANYQQPSSFPELKLGQYSGSMSSFGASTSNGSGIETLSGNQFLWGSPTPYSENPKPTAWGTSLVGHSLTSSGHGHGHGFPFSDRHGSYIGSSQHHPHHVGSAPSGVHLERRFGFFPESPETSFMNHGAFGGMNLVPNNGSFMMNMGSRSSVHTGIAGNISENGSHSFRMMSSQRLSPVFLGNGLYPGLTPNSLETEHARSRRVENGSNQMDSKRQFQLDLEKIASGEDSRTTLMIKNIPNKYTSKMLLAAIDENHKGTYDFLYLPIDFKNKCNVGYAFINMLSPSHIIPFYEAFNGKKWEKFNSEKVASLAYARIQGRAALIAHFQNSSLMNEDKRCRPILFHSDGTDAAEQVQHPNGSDFGDTSESIIRGGLEEQPDIL
ncbi:Protein MEI2-like 2 [Ancistrocladus abbreviatus]